MYPQDFYYYSISWVRTQEIHQWGPTICPYSIYKTDSTNFQKKCTMHFCCCWKFYFLFYEWNNNIDILSVLMCKIVEFNDSHMFMFNVYDYVTTGLYFSLLPRNLVSPPQNVPISGVCLYFTLNKKMCNIYSIWQMFCLLLSPPVCCYITSMSAHPSWTWNFNRYFTLELGYFTLSNTLLAHPSWTPLDRLRLIPHKQISPRFISCTF